MESENKNLENGKEYSVKQLLSTDHRKIIIPDFQRDYCWGNKNYGENNDTDIVSSFIQTLVEEQENGDIVLGKIDVYQNPKNHIHLTDGQQRLTTIYLLLGMLARKTSSPKKEELKNCLISEYEKNDDKESYLQYSIRESSLFFLRDLVNDFFIIENNYSVKDLEKQSWYFKEYDLDPTIKSMLRALNTIETEINKIKEIDFFADFVLNKIKIQYYDVVDRKHGEERFVIINTTGKQLSVSENIKPILLGKIKDANFATKWEERETYFWKNRNKEKKEFTSDKGVTDFMIWCFQIIRKQEAIDLVKISKETLKNNDETAALNSIDSLFGAFQKLESILTNEEIQKQFKFVNNSKEVKTCIHLREIPKQETTNVLLPILYFIEKISDDTNDVNQFVRRLRKNYFDNKREERNSNYLDWRYVLQIIEKSKSLEDCLTFKNENFDRIGVLDIPVFDWYNAEEQLKTELKKENQQLIEEIEDHQDFMGDLNPLFSVVEHREDITTLKLYYDWYVKIQKRDIDNINIRNLYRLNSLLSNGYFDHRGVGGYGYCMLVESRNKSFLLNDFDEIWRKYVNEYSALETFFETKIATYFKENNILGNLMDTHSHYNRVKTWALLEYLYNKNKEIDFEKSISCFWEITQNLKIQGEAEDLFKIGNLKLGVSWFNNKTGWVQYELPLMKMINEIKNEDFNIEDFTREYAEKLKLFLN